MTDLRTAAQQALEACEQRLPLNGQAAIIDELNNLRAALAQQAVPVQEPVAWRDSDNSDPGQGCTYDKAKAARWPHIYKQPLYTAPLQRKPLTEEEIAAEWQKASECASKSEGAVTTSQFVQMFARAIERAHGIPMPEAPACPDCHGVGYDASGQLCACQENPSF